MASPIRIAGPVESFKLSKIRDLHRSCSAFTGFCAFLCCQSSLDPSSYLSFAKSETYTEAAQYHFIWYWIIYWLLREVCSLLRSSLARSFCAFLCCQSSLDLMYCLQISLIKNNPLLRRESFVYLSSWGPYTIGYANAVTLPVFIFGKRYLTNTLHRGDESSVNLLRTKQPRDDPQCYVL